MRGTNPRDFLASLGLLRVAAAVAPGARLSFSDDGSFVPILNGIDSDEIIDAVVRDAAAQAGPQAWRLEYEKIEKRGVKRVADLKPPPATFRSFIAAAIASWTAGQREGAAYAASFATDVAVDGKGNTKPTALHFTAANQQFLDTIERVRALVDVAWCREALFVGHADRPGPNLRWDPGADRAYALMAADPNERGTTVSAPLEWLAFRALPMLPVVPRGNRVGTTGVRGRGDDMRFEWPLWSPPASAATALSLIRSTWADRRERDARGVFALCRSNIRRTPQGFGNFGPAEVTV